MIRHFREKFHRASLLYYETLFREYCGINKGITKELVATIYNSKKCLWCMIKE